ncbi:MAG: hypothetical protein QM704_10115 [Anaeromyxobacteraceae bacterium]
MSVRWLIGVVSCVLVSSSPASARDLGPCRLLEVRSEELPSRACLSCHDGGRAVRICPGHKVGEPYPELGDSRNTLRTLREVRRRGVNLPGGNVECVTCHSGRSPWESHLALPEGTHALPRVDPHDPRTYEDRPNWRLTLPDAAARVPGTPVCPAMLCVSCHAFADP